MKQTSIDAMTPNKLAVYCVADIVLADVVVADVDFPCGQYCLAVADMVCGRYDRTPSYRRQIKGEMCCDWDRDICCSNINFSLNYDCSASLSTTVTDVD